MRRLFQVTTPGIGTKLTAGFGILVGLTLLVVALAFVAGRDATRDIEVLTSFEGMSVPIGDNDEHNAEETTNPGTGVRGIVRVPR